MNAALVLLEAQRVFQEASYGGGTGDKTSPVTTQRKQNMNLASRTNRELGVFSVCQTGRTARQPSEPADFTI